LGRSKLAAPTLSQKLSHQTEVSLPRERTLPKHDAGRDRNCSRDTKPKKRPSGHFAPILLEAFGNEEADTGP